MLTQQLIGFISLIITPTFAFAIGNCLGDAKTNSQKAMKQLTQAVNFYRYDGVTAVSQVEDNRQGELASVGQIVTPYSRSLNAKCTGFALIHPQVVVTNAHCFFPSTTDFESLKNKLNTSVEFRPGVYQGIVQDSIRGNLAMIGTSDYDNDIANDYAVVVLERPISAEPILPATGPTPSKDLVAASYTIDKATQGESLTFVAGCTSNGMKAGTLTHFCNASKGGSGGLVGVADMVRDKNGRLLEANNIRAIGIHVFEVTRNKQAQFDVIPGKGNENLAVPIANVLPDVNLAIKKLKEGVPWNKIE